MFYVISLKKFRLCAVLALLFSLLTAIIIFRSRQTEAAPVSAEVSAPVLVIDAGHGGLDGGASSADGMTESSVNLAIAQRLEALAGLFGISSVMTRSSEELDYPEELDSISSKKTWDQKSRVELINSTPGAVLISIHQNLYPDPRPSGPQALYAATEGSRELGELIHSGLTEYLCPDSRRVAAPISENIYLMRSVKCPAVLVECGFLSNEEEASLLAQDGYRTKLALILLSAFCSFCEADTA